MDVLLEFNKWMNGLNQWHLRNFREYNLALLPTKPYCQKITMKMFSKEVPSIPFREGII
jgi:hypothetical protein